MSTQLPGNPYAANAEYIDRAPDIRLIDAALALAYEQRTANLIAYESGLAQAFRDNTLNENGVRLWKIAADQINERLGL